MFHLIHHAHEDTIVFITLKSVTNLNTYSDDVIRESIEDRVTAIRVIIDTMPTHHRPTVISTSSKINNVVSNILSVITGAGHKET